MFALPLTGSKARELMGDVAHVAEVLAPENRSKLLPFGEALRKARAYMATADDAARRVTFICFGNCNIRSQHGRIVLVSVGRKGGWRKEWDFGPA